MNKFRRIFSFTLILCLLFSSVAAQQAQEQATNTKPQSTAELQQRIAALLDQPKFAAARWGVRIITANEKAGGKVIFERDADKAFMPASNLKLYTSAAALDAFGPDNRFKTSVYATKPINKSGAVRGDLILYGRGDPNLSPRFDPDNEENYDGYKPQDVITAIERLADQIKARGVKVVAGNIIGDESYFAGDPLGPAWSWEDLQFYYGAEVSALTVNDNAVSFTVTPARKAGVKPVITIQPHNNYVKIINHAVTSESGQTRIGVNRPLNSNTVEFFGSIPRDAKELTEEIAVHDPASFAATLLKEALVRRRVRINGQVRRMDAIDRIDKPFDESKLTEIASIESQPLSELIKVINKPSQNLHTEIMLRQLGTSHPEAGTLNDYGHPKPTAVFGNEARTKFLQKAGIDTQNLSLRDGSGLSRQDLVTPRSTSRLLEFMLTHPHFNTFRDSLTIAGVDGTLERRMRETAAAANARGKTGTLRSVSALSGYVTTKRGQLLIFSLMGNNYVGPSRDVTAVMDQICVLLAEDEFHPHR